MIHYIGRGIGRYPWIFLISSLILVIPFSSFFLLKPILVETDIRRGFAPEKGRAMEEFKAFINYRTNVENVELAVVLIEAPEGKSLMPFTPDLISALGNLSQEIDALSIPDTSNASTVVTLKDLRGQSNYLFELFLKVYQAKHEGFFGADSLITLRFPVCEVMGNKFNIGGHFFGVKEYPKEEWDKHESSIESVEAIAFWYIFDIPKDDPRRAEAIKQLEKKLFQKSQAYSHPLFRFHMYADVIANEEMARGSHRTVNLLIFGLLLMLAFMTISMWSLSWRTKIVLIPSAVLTPLLAAITTFGLLGWCGFSFNSIMAISPFLLLGIGVDDAFLLLHCWKKHRANPKYSGEDEIAVIVSEVGPSILITSVTNCLAFGVGYFAPAPQMSSFCLCTSIAVLVDFVFEFTIFAPCLAILSRRAQQPTVALKASTVIQSDSALLRDYVEPNLVPKKSKLMRYCKFITSKQGKLAAVGIALVIYGSAYFGLSKMRTTFEPQKTFPLDSPLQESLRIVDKVLVQYSPLTFVVNNPPNITDSEEYGRFLGFIQELEGLPETYGPDWTQLFLRDYISFDKALYSNSLDSNSTAVDHIPSWNNLEKYAEERGISKMNIFNFHTNPLQLKSFVFVLVAHGKRSWHDRAYFIEKVRGITDKYPEFGVTVFDYDATIFDLIITVKWEMMKAVLVTLLCMSIVCFIIIPSIFYTGIALIAILSISFTLVGALGWWGQDLDPVTMINILMAIGFSVDFCAHICYHYYKHSNKAFETLPKDSWIYHRLYLIMTSVGRPTIEAALSTIVCIIPLFFIDVYVVQCFAKTVVCVGTLGILHGMFLIPAVLSSRESLFGTEKEGSAKSLCSTESGESGRTL